MSTEVLEKPAQKPHTRPDLKPRQKKRFWTWRRGVQLGFVALNIILCAQFYRFVVAAQSTMGGPLPLRPPGVEGWLPISGMMGAIDWIAHGSLNPVHPAATILFLAFLTISIVFRKAFCSWLCPIGTLSEGLAKLGRKLFGRNFLLPRFADRLLMSLKYLLLGFFVFFFFLMGAEGIASFISSPYNQVADVKMLLFFAHLGIVGALVILSLAIASIFVKGFWCRYLCPYGALLGLFSWLSPVKVRRNPVSCIDCAKCDKVCPARLPIMIKNSIVSVECTGCMDCVNVCPVKNTLEIGTRRRNFSAKQMAAGIALMFILFVIGARIFGVWQTSVTDEAYRYHVTRLNGPEYGHPGMGHGQ
jgi:polyferredoxin